jgi:hypothetical protein
MCMAEHAAPRPTKSNLIFNLALILILLVGTFLRFSGIDWGEYSFMHPDERFLLMVGSSIEPVDSLSEYFDTANSSLNPHNRGHGFYVYGTLPLFLARYIVQAVYGQSGLVEMTDVGRFLAASADMLIVLLVYLIAARLFGKRVALLATAFSALTVLQIQQSHFFTMDPFITFFAVLAIYFSVQIATSSWPVPRSRVSADAEQQAIPAEVPSVETTGQRVHAFAPQTQQASSLAAQFSRVLTHPLFWSSIAFGFATGCAVASKDQCCASCSLAAGCPGGPVGPRPEARPATSPRRSFLVFGLRSCHQHLCLSNLPALCLQWSGFFWSPTKRSLDCQYTRTTHSGDWRY